MFKRLLSLLGLSPSQQTPIRTAPVPSPAPAPEGSSRIKLLGTGEFQQEVVGESFYQEGIARAQIAAEGKEQFGVYVIAETDNPHDPQAVKILSADQRSLGHLPRPINRLWWDELKAIQDSGKTGVCRARVIGGGDGRNYGVLLDLPLRSAPRTSSPVTVTRVYDDDELEFSWTHNGETVTLDEMAWAHREPDTIRPKRLDDRFYNELSPKHVSKLLKSYAQAKNKKRAEGKLLLAMEAAAAPSNEGPQATALALLLTQQHRDECFDPDSYSSAAAALMRSKMLERLGRMDESVEVVREALTWATWPHGVKQLQSRLKTIERRMNPKPKRPRKTAATTPEPVNDLDAHRGPVDR